jgi:hypothetical protein
LNNFPAPLGFIFLLTARVTLKPATRKRSVMTMPATRSSDPSSHADHNPNHLDRRGFLTRLGSGLLVATGGSIVSAAAFAEELDRTARVRTPWQTEGPFYPRPLPLDKDNDLVIVNNALTPAVGEITHLSGRILDARGNPVKNAVIEIWQVDHHWRVPAHRQRQLWRARQELSGMGPFRDRLDLANIVSAPSSPFRIRAARPTSTSR